MIDHGIPETGSDGSAQRPHPGSRLLKSSPAAHGRAKGRNRKEGKVTAATPDHPRRLVAPRADSLALGTSRAQRRLKSPRRTTEPATVRPRPRRRQRRPLRSATSSAVPRSARHPQTVSTDHRPPRKGSGSVTRRLRTHARSRADRERPVSREPRSAIAWGERRSARPSGPAAVSDAGSLVTSERLPPWVS